MTSSVRMFIFYFILFSKHFILLAQAFSGVPHNLITMSVTDYVAVGASESFDGSSVDFAQDKQDNGVAMEVEAGETSETKTTVAGNRDGWWMTRGPHDGPQAIVENELPVPATNSVVDEGDVLASKTHAEHVQSIDDLKSKLTLLTDRVGTLEEELKELKGSAASQPSHGSSASASQPQHDAVAASSASASLQKKRNATRQFRVPKFEPYPMNSGECYSCHRAWSSAESTVHFKLDHQVWQQAMNKLFDGFESRGGLDGGYYDFIEASVNLPYNVQNSLVSCEVLTDEQGAEFASLLATKLWQPDVRDDRCWFLYRGGEKATRYITFGCVHCQRGTTLNYRSETFWTDFRRYFQ